MPESEPLFLPVATLVDSFRTRELSPIEVTERALERIAAFDGHLHSYLTVTPEPALDQAREAERLYRERPGALPPLLGVPVSIKDLFDVRGQATSLGSLVYRGTVAEDDSEPVRQLRRAGAVFLGKTNTPEFGQSATTENLLGAACANPWDVSRTAGGSSGGAAASVGAGLATVALGSDGGGSIRIPAAMCGLFGIKPTLDPAANSSSLRAMTDFVCPGPIARTVADARTFLAVLLGRALPASTPSGLRIAWCPAPEGRPVQAAVRMATAGAVRLLAELGHQIEEVALPVEGWLDAFGPLVLADEWRERRHLLEADADKLTRYARRTIEAAARVTDAEIEAARELKARVRDQIAALFEDYDLVLTPTTASVAFPIGNRPTEIDGRKISGLWGPFPFTAPFNVSGSPAASIPIALADGLPIGLQVIGPAGGERQILDLSEQLEAAISFPVGDMERRWRTPSGVDGATITVSGAVLERGDDLVVERTNGVTIVYFNRPATRNALTSSVLERLQGVLPAEVCAGARAVILTGSREVFSAGMDLGEIGHGIDDLRVDEVIAETTAVIRQLPIPVIAAVEGPCIGAALEITVACDGRVAGRESIFSIPAARLGLLYRPHAIADMLATLGRGTVSRLLVFGDRISADEALSAQLVHRVVDRGSALRVALEFAMMAAHATTDAVRATKQLINEISGATPDLSGWEDVRMELLRSETRRQSVAAAKSRLGAAAADDET